METFMPARRMHVDEVNTDVSLVRRLLAAQFPRWADLPVEPVDSAGTDNALFRLDGDMVVRLARTHRAAGQVDEEHQWLPKLARLLHARRAGPVGQLVAPLAAVPDRDEHPDEALPEVHSASRIPVILQRRAVAIITDDGTATPRFDPFRTVME
jgi:hypothetical protein